MKQVVVIHGGDVFGTYQKYLQFLKDLTIDPPTLVKGRGWKHTLQEALGPGYQVILPQMPNKANANYAEWKIMFEKYLPFIHDDVLLVGHSLGGSFLAKYLAEECFPKKIAGISLVAAPYDLDGDQDFVEFAAPSSLEFLARQGGEIFLYHSSDDPTVAFSELRKYQAALPMAHARIFSDRQHVNQDEFRELVSDVQSIA